MRRMRGGDSGMGLMIGAMALTTAFFASMPLIPQRRPRPEGIPVPEVNGIIREANNRITKQNKLLKTLRQNAELKTKQLSDEILDRDEYIDALEMRITELEKTNKGRTDFVIRSERQTQHIYMPR